MAATAKSPEIVEAVGSMTKMVVGVAGGSGTSTVLTIPQLKTVELVVACAGGSTATAPRADTYSGNTATITHANNEVFTYIAYGKAKI
jgi:hypothetical protein